MDKDEGVITIDVEMYYYDISNPKYKKGFPTQVALMGPNNKIIYYALISPESKFIGNSIGFKNYCEERFSYDDMQKALSKEEVADEVMKIVQGKILVGYNINTDLKLLGIHKRINKNNIRNITEFPPFLAICDRVGNTPKLANLCIMIMGNDIQNAKKCHCPKEDASASLSLYLKYREIWEYWIEKGCKDNLPEIQELINEMKALKARIPINKSVRK